MPLKATSAKVNISGVIADVKVTQIYKNEGKKALEALYIFPCSTRAAVYGMRMTIGTRVIEAKVAKREEARRTYEEARDQGKSASLLEQQRPNVFQMNVANIMPGDEIKVELKYTELLVPTEGVYEFVYPTVVGPRYSNQKSDGSSPENRWVQNPYLHSGEAPTYTFDISAGVTAGMPIRQLSCPSHKVNVSYEGPSVARVSLESSEQHGGNRDYILRYSLDGDRIETGLLLYKGEKENFFLLMMEPPKRVKKSEILDREYIFIVDVSGSMFGYPLDVSKKLIKDLLSGLRPSDLFNIVLFAGGSSVMAEHSVPATEKNIARGLELIDRQQGGGGTELLPALKKAFGLQQQKNYSRTVVIATDGFVNVEEGVFDLIRKRLGSANVFAFGIGTSVNRHLIEGMAVVGMGESFVVTKPEEAPSRAERFRAMIQSPVLTRVNVKFEGFEACEVEPPHIPDVFSERPVIVFGKVRGKPHGKIIVSGISGRGEYHETINTDSVVPSETNGGLRYLWARHRIKLLSDYNSLRPDDRQTEAITELGLRYNLLTSFTSFVAVDTQIRGRDGKPVSVKQPLPLPQGVSDHAVGASMAMGSRYAMKARLNMHSVPAAPAYDRSTMAMLGEMKVQEKVELDTTGNSGRVSNRTITLGDVIASGGLSKDAVSKVVRERMGDLEKYYQGADSSARLVVSFKIDANGAVREVKVLTGGSDFSGDIVDQIKKWQFPSGGGGAETSAAITLLLGS
jgi:Ca-activated chloride channel family protein